MYRFPEEVYFKNHAGKGRNDSIDTYWDSDYDLDDPGGWESRHTWEARVLTDIIQKTEVTKILELGSGPGNLADKVIKATNVSYTMIDGPSALRAKQRRGYSGTLLVQDLFDNFDTTGLDSDFELVVANDFLEHIRNPSLILEKVRDELTTDNSYFFISSPNWRMKHQFFYPGLFDFDNLLKFMQQESFELIQMYDSWAQHVPIRTQRLSSESTVPEGHLLDWNYYLLFKKK